MVFAFRLERPLGYFRNKMLIACVVITDGFLTVKASFQQLHKADTHTRYIIITINIGFLNAGSGKLHYSPISSGGE